MGRVTFEMNGFRYSVPKSDSEVEALFEQIVQVKIEKTNGHSVEDTGRCEVNRDKLPTTKQITDFIRARPGYAHDRHEIAIHFFGTEMKFRKNDKEFRALYEALSKRLTRARRRIATSERGKWAAHKDGWGQPKSYRFVAKTQ